MPKEVEKEMKMMKMMKITEVVELDKEFNVNNNEKISFFKKLSKNSLFFIK
jgi:hypothetical protein